MQQITNHLKGFHVKYIPSQFCTDDWTIGRWMYQRHRLRQNLRLISGEHCELWINIDVVYIHNYKFKVNSQWSLVFNCLFFLEIQFTRRMHGPVFNAIIICPSPIYQMFSDIHYLCKMRHSQIMSPAGVWTFPLGYKFEINCCLWWWVNTERLFGMVPKMGLILQS